MAAPEAVSQEQTHDAPKGSAAADFVADEWMSFDIDERRYGRFLQYIDRIAKVLTCNPHDQDDIRGNMWQACLELRLAPPANYPLDSRAQDSYCETAMYHAGLRCLKRDLPDGPLIRPYGYVDPDRMTESLPDPE